MVIIDHFSGFIWVKSYEDKVANRLVEFCTKLILSCGYKPSTKILFNCGSDVTNKLTDNKKFV